MSKPLQGLAAFLRGMSPVRFVTLGYLAYALLGWLVLCMPLAHARGPLACLDNLFTSVLGKWIVILLMFMGRVGPLGFGLSLFCGGAAQETGERADLAV
jgi:hypothetical protein